MKFYSKLYCELFILNKQIDENITSKIDLDTRIKKFDCFSSEDWRRIKNLQGGLAVSYLKYRYGSPETYVLCSYAGGKLVHIEWLVPSQKMRRRYPFIENNCYAVISCFTVFGKTFSVAGGGYLRHFPYIVTKQAIKHIQKQRPVIVYMHPYEIDTEDVTFETEHLSNSDKNKVLAFHKMQLRNRKTMFQKLLNLLSDFKFAPIAQIIDSSNLRTQSL